MPVAKSMMVDFGDNVAQCVLGTNGSSAKSMVERRGAGRSRHLHCPLLWLQESVDSGESRMEKRKGDVNTADISTKAVTFENVEDGLARWTTPVDVECCIVTLISFYGMSEAANLVCEFW